MLDPVFAALTTQIAAVEQALPRERIAEIVNGSFRQLPVARRTLDLVTQAPGPVSYTHLTLPTILRV